MELQDTVWIQSFCDLPLGTEVFGEPVEEERVSQPIRLVIRTEYHEIEIEID